MAFNIKEILGSHRKTYNPFDDGTGKFIPVDSTDAEKQLKLLERSQDNGKKKFPPASSKQKDSLAKEIDMYLSSCIEQGKTKLLSRIDAMKRQSEHQTDESILNSIKTIHEDGENELRSLCKVQYGELFSIKRDWVLSEKEYKLFRDEHNRIGPARYVDDKRKASGIIFLCLVLEILINAYTLGGAHNEGILGVVSETFLFAVINIGFALIIGTTALKFINHVNYGTKLMGYALTLILSFFIICVNMFIAHYRDALALKASSFGTTDFDNMSLVVQNMPAMDTLGAKAFESVINNPTGLQDAKSFLLFGFGLIVAYFASRESYLLDDLILGMEKFIVNKKNTLNILMEN